MSKAQTKSATVGRRNNQGQAENYHFGDRLCRSQSTRPLMRTAQAKAEAETIFKAVVFLI